MQSKQSEWQYQWENHPEADELFLFQDWIYPATLEDFRGQIVLECGCGSGRHTAIVAPFAQAVTAVDLNTAGVAHRQREALTNVRFVEEDIAIMNLGQRFDIVFCVGVLHHTDDPDKTFENIKRHVKPGGKLILWVYSREGNWLAANVVEPARKMFLARLSRRLVWWISVLITLAMYMPICTVYLLPLRRLPYYEYFQNFRQMSLRRNALNVFDKLNAPQTEFIERSRVERWFDVTTFADRHISPYSGVSWRGSGILRKAGS